MENEQTLPRSQANGETLKSKASELTQEAKQRGRKQLDTTKQAAADQAQKVAGVIEQASAELGRHDQQSLARYTGDFANSIKTLADNLKNRSIDELGNDALALARRNPTLFLLGSVAIGFALSRFIKASPERHENESDDEAPSQVKSERAPQLATQPARTGDADLTPPYPENIIPEQVKGD